MSEIKTNFKLWRVMKMGWSQQRCADELGISVDWVKMLDAGKRRGSDKPAHPSIALRYMMAVKWFFPTFPPWPK